MQRMISILAGVGLMVMLAASGTAHAATEKAIVAGGCFWCVESDFEKVPGVRSVVSGYTGGTMQNPTYPNHEGHYEAVEITFDNSKISYDQLIAMFLRSVDVTDNGGQFCDRGPAYRTAIFVSNPAQKAAAEAAVAEAGRALGKKIVTPVLPASTFWKAEAYHQDYYKSSDIILTRAGPKQKKNAYTFYRQACGRDARVKQIWGKQAAFAK
ncbi:peptide-methionine (S)-S-oxide reductase [Pseudotabrizicola alkalilacus]|uniref:Peptide methionine sulfoxide reductase MsrA n=2 Tax=Pseudotabrizicola alkalilacus TaxID=2305252 RepID=A0A411YY86_9RHOB|nr:peptide-methionine (S)-S-oxide reductase [Pseudotabrizicola alkalilacus]